MPLVRSCRYFLCLCHWKWKRRKWSRKEKKKRFVFTVLTALCVVLPFNPDAQGVAECQYFSKLTWFWRKLLQQLFLLLKISKLQLIEGAGKTTEILNGMHLSFHILCWNEKPRKKCSCKAIVIWMLEINFRGWLVVLVRKYSLWLLLLIWVKI